MCARCLTPSLQSVDVCWGKEGRSLQLGLCATLLQIQIQIQMDTPGSGLLFSSGHVGSFDFVPPGYACVRSTPVLGRL